MTNDINVCTGNRRLPLTSNIRQAYETKAYLEACPKVDFTRNFARVIRGIIFLFIALLELDQRL